MSKFMRFVIPGLSVFVLMCFVLSTKANGQVPPIGVGSNSGPPPPYPNEIEITRKTNDIIKKMDIAKEKRDYKQIVALAKSSLALDNLSITPWEYLAEAYDHLHDNPSALIAYRRYIYPEHENSGWGGNADVRMRFVLLLLRGRMWDEAVLVYNHTLEKNTDLTPFLSPNERTFSSKYYESLRMEGLAHLIFACTASYGGPESEKERTNHFKTAIAIRTRDPLAHYHYARFLNYLLKLDEARIEMQKAMDYGDPTLRASIKSHYAQLLIKPTPIGPKKID